LQPFRLDGSFLRLRGQYPDVSLLTEVVRAVHDRDRIAIVRLWLTEGIPYGFQDCPGLYEAVRAWLGWRLSVHPKNVTLIGSARLGYSLAPEPQMGRAFGVQSDLDFCVVSPALFQELVETFRRWANEYESDVVHPRDDREKLFWDDNRRVVPRGIRRGAIDPKKTPTWDRYPAAQRVVTALWALTKKLEATLSGPVTKRSSVRVYRDWDALTEVVSTNLKFASVSRLRSGGGAA
jgi:hypothetical protein